MLEHLINRKTDDHPWQGKMGYGQLCACELRLLQLAFPEKNGVFFDEVKQLDHYLIACYRKEWPVP